MSKRKTIKCSECGSEVSLSNFKAHYRSKKCLSGGKQVQNSSTECVYCKKQFSSPSGRGVHEVQCLLNPQRIKKHIWNSSRCVWNKGLTAETDERVAENAAAVAATRKENPIRLTQAQKDHLSKIAKSNGFGGYRENAGRSKKFRVLDSYGKETVLQSSYELRCSEILNRLGIEWYRPKALKYDNRNYFADFYLPKFGIYLDPKNSYKAKLDQEKINKVIEQNNVKVVILLDHQLTEQYIGSVIQ